MSAPMKPYITHDQNIPEFSTQAVVLGLVLCFIMCAANVYVGLYAGMTVSAAIPASVISMGVLRGILKRGTILENNIVHTIASSGESLAAGIIFTVPAILLLGIWDHFNYLETTLIALAGGVLGVLMMIPLRRSLVVENTELRYPEGVACAEVLKAGDKGGEDLFGIFWALGLGMAFKILGGVFGVFKGTVEGALRFGRTAIGGGSDISPMLAAVGFICGWEISLLVFAGGAIAWFVVIPILIPIVQNMIADPAANAATVHALGALPAEIARGFGAVAIDDMNTVWNKYIRFFGIGTMIVGGVWSIIQVRKGIMRGLGYALAGLRGGTEVTEIRTEQNIKGAHLAWLILACVALIAIAYFHMTGHVGTTIATTVAMFVLAFFFIAVASYIAGLVGSSNSPVSGMTICTVLLTAGLLIVLGYTGAEGMLATLGVAGVVCCAASIGGDISQDLKIGYILGATPRRQQWAEVLGTVAAAFIIAPVMTLLHKAYGIGTGLKAPQANLFKSLVGALFDPGQHMPWILVGLGAALGVLVVLADKFVLEPRRAAFRLHVMPLAVGIYLPLSVSAPLLVGGAASWWIGRRTAEDPATRTTATHRGTLFASGIVAGEAIAGILIAGLIILVGELPLKATDLTGRLGVGADVLSVVAMLAVAWGMVRYAMKKRA